MIIMRGQNKYDDEFQSLKKYAIRLQITVILGMIYFYVFFVNVVLFNEY